MKNAFAIIVLSLFSFSLFAQGVINVNNENNQSKLVIKTNPISIALGNYKMGVEYAKSEVVSFELEYAIKHKNAYGTAQHVQFRVKRDIINDQENLAGLYIAGGVNVGQWGIYNEQQTLDFFGTVFTDLGYQTSLDRLNLDFFTGLGLTYMEGFEDDYYPGCMGCGIEAPGNSFNFQALAFRLGMRVGLVL